MRMALMVSVAVIPLLLAVPVLIGVYVYRDASRRGMNAALWTLLALLGPAFSGLILYLIVRGNYAAGSCPRCGERVRKEYTVCPSCGAKLRPACQSCGYPVEKSWTVCPRCARPLERDWTDVTPPEVRPDRLLPKVLAVIVLVPVLLIALALLMFTRGAEGGASAQTTVEIGDYLAVSDHAQEVQAWLDTADRIDRAYALRYTEKTGDLYECRLLRADADPGSGRGPKRPPGGRKLPGAAGERGEQAPQTPGGAAGKAGGLSDYGRGLAPGAADGGCVS